MLSPVVTKRYAQALLDAAQAADAVAAVEADLDLASRATSQGRIAYLLGNPTIEADVLREELLKPLSAQLKTKLVKNTVALLIDRRRAAVLFHLSGVFHRLALESRGEAEGFIEAAVALSPQEIRTAEESVSKRISRKVTLTMHVDPSLMGGVRVTVGSQRFDATLRSRLNGLRERMLSAQL